MISGAANISSDFMDSVMPGEVSPDKAKAVEWRTQRLNWMNKP